MNINDIAADVSKFVKLNYLFDETKHLDPAEPLIGSGIIDSTGILELVAYLEKRHNIHFEDHELTADNFGSVETISRFISGKLDAVAGSQQYAEPAAM